jgi:ATP-binding cassette, subfamily C, bacterial CydD
MSRRVAAVQRAQQEAVGGFCDTGLVRHLDPRLMRYASGIRTLLVASVVLGAASAAVVITQAILLAGILADVIIDGQGLAEVSGRLIWLAIVIAVRAALAWASEEIAGRSAGSVTAGLRRDLLRHAAGLGPRWRSGEHGGELAVLATTGVESLHDYVARYLPQLVLSVVIPLIMLVYLFTADLTSALIVAFTLPLIPLFMALVGWYTDRQTRAKWQSLSRLAGHFTDVVAGLPTLKVFGRAKAQAAAVRKVTDDYRRASLVTLRVAFLSSMVLELLASLSVALVAVAIGLRLVYGDLTLQVGLAVLILAPEAYLPLRQLGTQFHAAADGVAASAKVLAILDTPVPAAGARADLPAVPGLRLDGVMVGEPGERGTIGPLTLDIPAGSFTVVTGDSGSGKTTLLHVLAGVQRPDRGHVLVRGGQAAESDPEFDLTDVDPASWRARLAWAGQGAVIQAGTIRDNLALGNPEADDAQLRSALEAVDAAGFVDELPGGWHTELGEGGAGISQGQRQRLALARALARPAALVLLDEPTAALDEATEQRVLAGIAGAARGRTVVLVTHRQAPVTLADRVVSMTSADDAQADGFGVDEPAPLPAVAPW